MSVFIPTAVTVTYILDSISDLRFRTCFCVIHREDGRRIAATRRSHRRLARIMCIQGQVNVRRFRDHLEMKIRTASTPLTHICGFQTGLSAMGYHTVFIRMLNCI